MNGPIKPNLANIKQEYEKTITESDDPDGDYECVVCGWTTDIDGAFRNREQYWCERDDELQWFKQTEDDDN
jgi:hypothetical protein